MTRIILVFGSIAGSLVALFLILGMTLLAGSDGVGSEAIGYLGMLLSLSIIFIAIKRHRDINLGGVIRFWPALALGLGVAALAGDDGQKNCQDGKLRDGALKYAHHGTGEAGS